MYVQVWQLQVYHGDALLEMREWRRAEAVYREALQAKKHYLKVKQLEGVGETGCSSEVDVK